VAGRGAGLLSASRAGTDGPISTIIHISAVGLASQSAGRTAKSVLYSELHRWKCSSGG